jgi:uncharacterized membrane protein
MQEQTLQSPRSVRKEQPYRSFSGYGIVAVVLLLLVLGTWAIVQRLMPLPMNILLIVVGVALLPGCTCCSPTKASS